uniref:Uncharacterized protein n=1 Tax=Timema monikensis TaxID=170555 RepID=A0A7R9HS80_9NEOP|nr:unnamed protein product [Timema monikensis]
MTDHAEFITVATVILEYGQIDKCCYVSSVGQHSLGVDMSQVFSKTGLVPLSSSALPTHLEVKQSTSASNILPPSYLTVDHNQVAEKERNHQAMWHTATLIGDSLKQEGKHLLDSETSNKSQSVKLMPPPLIPLVSRHCIKSLELKVETEDDNQLSPDDLKGIDLRMKPTATVLPMATVADLSSTQSPSMATLRRFVGEDGASSLPTQSAQSVEKFLSRIENKSGSAMLPSSEQHKILFSTAPLYSTESSKQSSVETGSTLHSQQKTFTDNSISILPTVTTVNFQTPSEQRNDLSSMHCSSSIIYTSDTPSTSSLVPNTITHNENKLMEDIPKSSEHGNLSVPNMLPSSLIETSVGTGNTTMNIENSTLREHILASTPLLSTHASRLEALVSSAIETQVQQQPSSTERLDALVNSAAESHLINTSSLSSVASSTVSINDNLHRQHFSGGLTTETSAMPMNMILDSSVPPSSSVAVFQLSNPQNVPQISQENVILNHVVSAAFNDHLLSASSLAQDKHLSSENTDLNTQLSPSNRPGLDSVVITAADHAILQSSSHDSSDAMLTCATATGEDSLLVSAASRTSPIAIKNMILNTAVASLEGDMQMAGPSRTSPIAIKAMLLDSHISAVMAQETSLVQSSLNSHLMTTNVAEPTRGSTLQSMLEDSGNIPTLLSGSTHSQKSPLTITQAPSLPEASHQLNTCITTSILPKEVQHNLQSGQLMYTSQASGEFVPHILVTNIGQKEMVAQCVEANHQTSIDNKSSHTMVTSTSQDRKTTTNVSSLPVPVADMSTKDVPGSGTVQKKVEEGMVPQELTQMSDNDLLSYINPSCFDQGENL